MKFPLGLGMVLAMVAGANAANAQAAPPLTSAPATTTQTGGSPSASTNGLVRYDPVFFTNAQPETAWDMIDRIPGFTFDGGENVRGFAGAAGNVLIDGTRPTTKQENLQNILQRIPANQVDHIDVIRGGAPGVDMQGRTVMANVVRKGGQGTSGAVTVSDIFYDDGRNAPNVKLEMTRKDGPRTFEFQLKGNAYVDDGAGDGPRIRTDAQGNTLIRSNLEAQAGGKTAAVTSSYETPLAGGKFRINGRASYDRYTDIEDDSLWFPAPDIQHLFSNQEYDQGELGLHWSKTLSPRSSLETLAIQQVSKTNYISLFTAAGDDEQFYYKDHGGESIVRGVYRFRKNDKFSTEFAAEGAYNFQTSATDYDVNGAVIALPAADIRVAEKRAEVSGQATWRPDKKFNLEAGVRAEVSNIGSTGDVVLSKTLFYPKPRVVLTWSPNDRNQLRLRFEREVGQLNFSDFAASSNLGQGGSQVSAGNPDLVPQQSWVAEAAYERHIKDMVFVVTARRSWIADVIDRYPIYDPAGVYDAPGNIGSAIENDLEVNFTVPLDRFGVKHGQFKGQATFRHSEVTDPTTGVERRISGQHPWDGEFHFNQEIPNRHLNYGVDVYNYWRRTNYLFSEIDVYRLKMWGEVFIEYKPKPNLSFRAEVDNIGSRGFERQLFVYTGPRNTSPLAYIDDRKQDFGPIFILRVRKSFG